MTGIEVHNTTLPGVKIVKPQVFGDHRGFFFESWNCAKYAKLGLNTLPFVQDNISHSQQGVLRGLHFQHPHAQSKLVHVLSGRVFDVAVDIRLDSPNFGQWFGTELNSDNFNQLFVPKGFAHGFVVLSESATFMYKCDDTYHPEWEKSIAYDDPKIAIQWPDIHDSTGKLVPFKVSKKDSNGKSLEDFSPQELPKFI